MISERDRNIQKLQQLNLTLPSDAVSQLSRVMGIDVSKEPTQKEIVRSLRWLKSTEKQRMEWVIGRALTYAGGKILVNFLKEQIRHIDGYNPIYSYKAGFFGSKSPPINIVKIRSMRILAEDERNESFVTTAFLGGSTFQDTPDDRILDAPIARLIRRTAVDELPQLVYQMITLPKPLDLVGARGWTTYELNDCGILNMLAGDSDLSLGEREKTIVYQYPGKAKAYNPTPAIIGPLSPTLAKNAPPIFRMFCDITYWERSNPIVDARLIGFTIQRLVRGIGAR